MNRKEYIRECIELVVPLLDETQKSKLVEFIAYCCFCENCEHNNPTQNWD